MIHVRHDATSVILTIAGARAMLTPAQARRLADVLVRRADAVDPAPKRDPLAAIREIFGRRG